MKLFEHHIYEYKKGVRNLVLLTIRSSDASMVIEKLSRLKISYFIQAVSASKTNIYFGKEQCVRIVRSFNKLSLKDFTCEEDFILGVMLGYDRMQQCERYLSRSDKQAKITPIRSNCQHLLAN